MKIIVFADNHNSKLAEIKLIKKIKEEKPELILCGGDFTLFMNDAKRFLKKIDKTGIKTYIIHGNHEDEETIKNLCRKLENVVFLHNKIIIEKHLLIMGYGGGGFSLNDSKFKKTAKEFKKILDMNKEKKKIMLVHQPPYKSGIDVVYGENAGSKTTKKFIEKHNIHFVFAGHLHETAGLDFKIKGIRYINPGPEGVILDV